MLSRKEKVEKNERRLKAIAVELEAIAQTQAQSTDPDEQQGCLLQLRTLGHEEESLKNANIVLQKELEAAERERVETNRRKWLEEERLQAEKELDGVCKKVLTKVRNLKKGYDELAQAEQRWAERWKELGRPQGIDHDRPFKSRSKRDIYQFLGMNILPRSLQNDIQKQVAEILGRSARIAAIVGAEERRAARRKESAAEVEKLRSRASPPQGGQSEDNESAEKTVDNAIE